MDIKLLFQILTPLSMGGSIIGLFGDFGDGWVEVSHKNSDALEFGGVNLYERNPHMFGLKDGNQRWNQAEVGKTYYDYYFQGITDLETFSTEPGSGKRNLLINGFGLQVQSKKGGVVSGQQGEATTAKDLREGSIGFATAKNGVREIQVTVKRVGIVSSKEGQVDQVVPLDDMCVVNVGGKNEVFMIFAGIRMSKTGKTWNPQDAERFIKLDGCRFFGSIPQDKRAWLRQTKLGRGNQGSTFIMHEGTTDRPGGEIGWKMGGASVFKESLNSEEYGVVALVGIVYDMTKFLPAAECHKETSQKVSFCKNNGAKLGSYKKEQWTEDTYLEKKGKFGMWVKTGAKKEDLIAATGMGWREVVQAYKGGTFGGWNPAGINKAIRDKFVQGGWNLPRQTWENMAWNLQARDHAEESDRTFKKDFRNQIFHGESNVDTKYEWKKTAVMRHEKIKELEKEPFF